MVHFAEEMESRIHLVAHYGGNYEGREKVREVDPEGYYPG